VLRQCPAALKPIRIGDTGTIGIMDGTIMGWAALLRGMAAMGPPCTFMVAIPVSIEIRTARSTANGGITTWSRFVCAGLSIGNVQLGLVVPALIFMED
jgi:hypothetical protein